VRVWKGERGRHRRVVVRESVRGRERNKERGVKRELNVGDRGGCRRYR
jgi:hypothetical protein